MCSSFEAFRPKHAVSLHLDMCVLGSLCALVFVYVSMTRSGLGECLCRCFACTEGKRFIFAHVWARPCGTALCSYSALSVPTLWPHLYLNMLSLLACSLNKQCLVFVSICHFFFWGGGNPLKMLWPIYCILHIIFKRKYGIRVLSALKTCCSNLVKFAAV